MSDKKTRLAKYDHVDREYLERRKLRKSAGWMLLWALGVGAVISGDFYGWNFGLATGGFWGLAIATVLMALMYVCMVYTIAELSAALPHAGGFFSFTRNAFGPTGGFICGLTDAIEYVITPAVIVVGIGGLMNTLVFESAAQTPAWAAPMWWLIAYATFVAINIWGVELTLKVGLVVTALAAGVLVVFYVSALASGAFDARKLFNIPPADGQAADGLPFGWRGVFCAAVCHLVLPGDRATSAGGRGGSRRGQRHAQGTDHGHRDAAGAVAADLGLEYGSRRWCGGDRHLERSLGRRLPGGVRNRSGSAGS